MNSIPIWQEKFDQRRDWLNDGIGEYCKSFHDDTIRSLVKRSLQSEMLAVALYGETQVGKTTFTLELLGIQEEHFARLNNLLRCGSRHGDSATPTAMVYRRSLDNHYYYGSPGQKRNKMNEDELESKLKELRKQVEKGGFRHTEEVFIEIPANLFKTEESGPAIQIIDLPGYGSKNAEEIEHVNNILKQFLPIVSLILVFTQGASISQISSLFKKNKHIDEYYGWRYLASKYRLITTYSYSPETVSKWILGKPDFTSADIQSYYRKEAKTKRASLIPDNVTIYPLEMGDSWQKLKNKREMSDVFPQIEAVCENLWQQLKMDIEESKDTINQIKSAREFEESIQKIKKKKIEKEDKKIAKLKKSIEDIEYNKSCLGDVIKKHELNIKKMKREMSEIDDYELETQPKYKNELDRDIMMAHIYEVTTIVEKSIKNFRQLCRKKKFTAEIKYNAFKDEIEEMFDEVKCEINKIWFNKPIFKLVGPEKKHVDKINAAIEKLNRLIKKKINAKLINDKNKFKEIRQKSIEKENIQIKKCKSEIEKSNKSSYRKKQEIERCNQEKCGIEKQYSKELSQAGKLSSYLDKAFNEHFEKKFKFINKEQEPIGAFFNICFCALMVKDYKKTKILNR